MPPNSIEPHVIEANDVVNGNKIQSPLPGVVEDKSENYGLKVFQSSLNLLAHILIGAVTGISIIWSFRNGTSLGPTPLHVLLCVLGYQLLMSQAILALSSDNGWSSNLKFIDKRRAHWVLQILGSGLALAGSFIKILDKTGHWNTLHGQWALVAMVFTAVSLVNGVASLYAYEWRGFMPGNISKITHICFGIVGYVASCISLCYGFDKNLFLNWATAPLTYTTMAFTGAFTLIVIINPTISFVMKTKRVIKK